MQHNNTFLIISVGILAALLTFLVGYVALRSAPAQEPVGEVTETVPENESEAEAETDSAPEETTDTEDAGNTDAGARPSPILIATSSYTVYLGFAERYGEPDSALMGQEVGEAVIGYEWQALPGPTFDSITLPAWENSNDERYEVFVWEEEEVGSGEYTSLGIYAAGDLVEFPREGFLGGYQFKVLGIDPDLRICPGDRTFTWDARFTLEGEFGLVRTPITEDLPAGEKCEMR